MLIFFLIISPFFSAVNRLRGGISGAGAKDAPARMCGCPRSSGFFENFPDPSAFSGRPAYNDSMDTKNNGFELLPYNRRAATDYARKWAFRRNPAYYDFSRIGGDCTNYASQCLYAGSGVMNFTPVTGWFYIDANDRTASWTGVEFFYRFLVGNEGAGPFAEETDENGLETGDFVQLGRDTGDFYHTPVVVGFSPRGVPLVAAHSYDVYRRPLTSYRFERLRCLHILGVRRPCSAPADREAGCPDAPPCPPCPPSEK